MSADPDRADVASAEKLLEVYQPAPNHNGGHLEFGPDGMLYLGLGDGGGAGDTGNNAQSESTLLGKMLRLALGESASALMASQRVIPRKAVATGYVFRFPSLYDALDDLLGK